MIPTKRRLGIRRAARSVLVVGLVAAWSLACEDGLPLVLEERELPVGLIVSEPTAGGNVAVVAAVTDPSREMAWISADPGTFDGGVDATVTNATSSSSAVVQIQDGGFDPVPISATSGERLNILVAFADGSSQTYAVMVPESRRPRVVRTRPTVSAVDIRLNTKVLVVFSEPVAPATVTPGSVRLDRGGTPVEGSLTLDRTGTRAEFAPESLLEPETTYTLTVSTDVLDLSGEPLEASVTASFRTAAALHDQIAFSSYNDEDRRAGRVYDSDIWVMRTDGSGATNLTNNPANDWAAAVSPDGTRILFQTERDGNQEVYVMNADGSGPVNLTGHPAWDGSPVWSPDGTRIAFVSYRSEEPGCFYWGTTSPKPCADIFVMEADGSNPVNLTNSPVDEEDGPVWSPDGTKIAFTTRPGTEPTGHIFVMDADGSNRIQLTTPEGGMSWGFDPAWSPDGTRIAFVGGPAGNPLWVMDADGSNATMLTGQHSAVGPAWSPDGSRIAFTMQGPISGTDPFTNQEIFFVDPDGSGLVQLTDRPAFYDRTGPQAWSPEGEGR